MMISKMNGVAVLAIAFALSGCMRLGNNNVNAYPDNRVYASAPTAKIVQSDLAPPPGDPSMKQDYNNNNSSTPMVVDANAPVISPSNVSGVWRASVGGMTCQVATPQTKFGQGYRAGPLNCPSAISSIRSWAVTGNQLIFYDANGGSVATLYSSGSGFNGQTTSGTSVSLSR